eukprot:768109-Hanusia_phi.AAC.5
MPGPKSESLLYGQYKYHRNGNICDSLLQYTMAYGKICCYRGVGLLFRVVVSDPKAIKHILVSKPDSFPKMPLDLFLIKRAIGNGLLVVEGSQHARQRKIISEAFHFDAISKIYPIFVQATEKLLSKWERLCSSKKSPLIDAREEFSFITLDVIGLSAFGFDFKAVEGDYSEIREAFTNIIPLAGMSLIYVILKFLPFVEFLPLSDNIIRNSAVKCIQNAVKKVIDERLHLIENGKEVPNDLLSLLLNTRQNASENEQLTEEEIMNNVQTFMLAGHETTANVLCWTFYLLSENPEFCKRLRSELWAKLQGKAPTMRQLQDKELPLLYATCKESMRLYPAAPIISRKCNEDTVLGGYLVPSGTSILISPWVLGRHPDYWERPNDFWPERWLEQSSNTDLEDNPFKWLPFIAGPRQCVGRGFAEKELMVVISLILQNFDLKVHPSCEPVIPVHQITLRPSSLKMRVTSESSEPSACEHAAAANLTVTGSRPGPRGVAEPPPAPARSVSHGVRSSCRSDRAPGPGPEPSRIHQSRIRRAARPRVRQERSLLQAPRPKHRLAPRPAAAAGPRAGRAGPAAARARRDSPGLSSQQSCHRLRSASDYAKDFVPRWGVVKSSQGVGIFCI